MFGDLKVYAFVLVAVLACTSCAPTDSTNANPTDDNPCVKRCGINYSFLPSCGTDDRDYANDSFYTCFENCGLNIKKKHDGRCKMSPTIQNSETCMNTCPVTADYRPFCGSDGKTHPTTGLLYCYHKCGVGITKVHDGAC